MKNALQDKHISLENSKLWVNYLDENEKLSQEYQKDQILLSEGYRQKMQKYAHSPI